MKYFNRATGNQNSGHRSGFGSRFAWRVLSFVLVLNMLLNSVSFAMDSQVPRVTRAVAERVHSDFVEANVEVRETDMDEDGNPSFDELGDEIYYYDFLDEKSVLLSSIFEYYELPVNMKDVDSVLMPGDESLIDTSEQIYIEPLKDAAGEIFDYRITAMQGFDSLPVRVFVGKDVYALMLTNVITEAGDAELSGDDEEDSDADGQGGETYDYDLAGGSRVLLSAIIAACGMPVSLSDVEMVGQPGGSDADAAPVSVEAEGDDYAIEAMEAFDEARLAVYAAEGASYAVRLLNGQPGAEETGEEEPVGETEATLGDDDEAAGTDEDATPTEDVDTTPDEDVNATPVDDADATPEEDTDVTLTDDTDDIDATTPGEDVDAALTDDTDDIDATTPEEDADATLTDDTDDTDATTPGEDTDATPGEGTDDQQEKLPGDLTENLPDDLPDDLPGDLTENLPDDLPDDLPGDLTENLPDDLPDDLPEDAQDAPALDIDADNGETEYLRIVPLGEAGAAARLVPVSIGAPDYMQVAEAYAVEPGEQCEAIEAILVREPDLAQGEYLALYGLRGDSLSDAPLCDHMAASESGVLFLNEWDGFALVKLGLTAWQQMPAASIGKTLVELNGALPVGGSVSVEPVVDVADGDNLLLACDIAIKDAMGNDFQPFDGAPVEVTVTNDAIRRAIESGSALNVSRYDDDLTQAGAVEVLRVEGEAVTFLADSGAVYAVREVVLGQERIATDGNTYSVTANYDTASGIPADAELAVSEIPADDERYESYVSTCVETLAYPEKTIRFSRVFDVSLVDAVTGGAYQPTKDVRIDIELLNDDLSRYAGVDVVRVDGEGRAVVLDSAVEGSAVGFETDGFAVFALCGYRDYTRYDGYHAELLGRSAIDLAELCAQLGIPTDGVTDVECSGDAIAAEATEDGWLIRAGEPAPEGNPAALAITCADAIYNVEIALTGVAQTDGEGLVIAAADGVYLPAEAEGRVAFTENAEAVRAAEAQPDAPALERGDRAVVRYASFNIALENVDPGAYTNGFNAAVTLPEDARGRDYRLYRVEDQAAEIVGNAEVNDGVLSFAAPDFGEYVLAYVVDLSGDEYVYDLAGERGILLSALLENLGIDEIGLADVADAISSDPKLLGVEAVEGDWQLAARTQITEPLPLTLVLRGGGSMDILIKNTYPAQSFAGTVSGVQVAVEAPEGAFPAGTTMQVRRIWDNGDLSEIRETVANDFLAVKRVQLVDIAFYDVDGAEIEPLAPVSVSMSVTGMNADQEAMVVHVDDEGALDIQESEVANPNARTMDVTFDAEAFSRYAVVVTETISTHYIDANGDTYYIEVSYGPEAGIPSGAALSVSEIPEGTETYDSYVQMTAEALDKTVGQFAFAHAFDISVIDPATGEHFQPGQPVSVSIRLLKEDVSQPNEINVVHFPEDEAGNAGDAEILEPEVVDGVVAFESDGFSVYVVTEDNKKPRVQYRFLDSMGVEYLSLRQTLAKGEVLINPTAPSDDGKVFVKWVAVEGPPMDVSVADDEFTGWGPVTEIEGTGNYPVVKYLKAVYATGKEKQVHITWYDQEDHVIRQDTVLAGTEFDPDVVDYNAVQMNDGDYLVFRYWTRDLYTPGADGKPERYPQPSAAARADTDVNLYPYCAPAHWLYFDGNKAKNDPTRPTSVPYTSPILVLEGEIPQKAECTFNVNGFTFDGWWTQAKGGNMIYDSHGDLVNRDTFKSAFYTGGDSLEYDPTLYAHWSQNTTTTYSVVYYAMKKDVPANKTPDPETDYVVLRFDSTRSAVTGQSVSRANQDTVEHAFSDEQDQRGFKLSSVNDPSIIVKSDGTSTLKVYFDRKVQTMHFVDYAYCNDDGKNGHQTPSDVALTRAYGNNNTVFPSFEITERYGSYIGDYFPVFSGVDSKGWYLKSPNATSISTGNSTTPMTCNSWRVAGSDSSYLFKRIEYMPAFAPYGDGTSRYHEYYIHNNIGSFKRYLYYYLEVLPGTQCKPEPVEINTNSSSSVNTKYVYNPTSSMVLYNGGSTQYPARTYTYELLGAPMGFGSGGVSTGNFQNIIGFTQQAYTPSGFGNNDNKNVYFFYTRNHYAVTLKCVLDRQLTSESNTVEFLYEQQITDEDLPRFAHENTMNVRNDLNSYWFYDEACTDPVDFENFTMPAYNITLYEGLRTSYPVAVDPAGGVLDGKNGSTWFNVDKGEAISEYAVTRDFVAASELNQQLQSGEGYFYKYNNEYDALQYGVKPRTAMYIQATETETGDYINYPGYWEFQYWYQVTATFDFTTNTFTVNEQPADEKTAYNFDNVVRGPVYLKAKWARAGSFGVVYDAGAARAPKDNERYIDGAKAVVKASVDNPAGYQFRFWSNTPQPKDSDGKPQLDGNGKIAAKPDVELYPNQSLVVSKELQEDPTEKVIRLYAWYEEGGYPENHYADYIFYIPDATLDENGQETWSEGENDIPYYIQTISPGENLVMPKTPNDPVTGRGGTFIGWFLDRDCTERFEGFGVIGTPKNTKLYACFAKIYTVKYHGVEEGNVETIVTVQTYRDGEALDTRQVQVAVTNDRFITFWSTDKNDDPNVAQPAEGTTRVDYRSKGKVFGATNGYDSDLVLYPILADAYTLHFDSCGGSYVAPLEMPRKVGKWRPAPEEPVREGYTFQGWFTAPDAGGIQYKFDMSLDAFVANESSLDTVPAILYAHWELDEDNPALSTVTVNIWVQNTARTGYTIWTTEQLNKPINSTIDLATLQNSDGKAGYLLLTDMLEGYYTFAEDKAKRLPDDRDYFEFKKCCYVTIGPKQDEAGNYFDADGNLVNDPADAEQVDIDNDGTSQTVKEDGSTKFNIYFDRKVYKLVFEPDRQYVDTELVGVALYYENGFGGWKPCSENGAKDYTNVIYTINGGFSAYPEKVDFSDPNCPVSITDDDYVIREIWLGMDVSTLWLTQDNIKSVQNTRTLTSGQAPLDIDYTTMNVNNDKLNFKHLGGKGFKNKKTNYKIKIEPDQETGTPNWTYLYEDEFGYQWFTPWEGDGSSKIWANGYHFNGWSVCEGEINGGRLYSWGTRTVTNPTVTNNVNTIKDVESLKYKTITTAQSVIDKTILFTADPADDTITLVADYDKKDVYTETYTRGTPVTIHYIVVDAAGNEIEKYDYQQTVYDIASAAGAGSNWKPTDEELQEILNRRSSIEGYVYSRAKGEYRTEQVKKYYYNYALPTEYAYTHRLGNLAGATFPDIYLNNNETTSLTRVREGDYQLVYTYTQVGQSLGVKHVHNDSDAVYLFDKGSNYYLGRSVRNELGVMSTADFRALIEEGKVLTYEAAGLTKEQADENSYYYYFAPGGSYHVNLYFEAVPYKLTLRSTEDKDWKQVSNVEAGEVKFTTFLTNAAGNIGYIHDTWGIEAPFIAGKRFVCWSKSREAATPFEGTMPDYPLTLYAHYEDIDVTVTLRGVNAAGKVNREEPEGSDLRKRPKTDENGVLLSWGTDDFSREKLYGTLLQAFELPSLELESNEEFHGWKRVLADGTLSAGYVSSTTQITEDSTLVPDIRYSKGGYVQYHANDGRTGSDVLGQDGGYYVGGTVRAKPGTENLTDAGAGLTSQKTIDQITYNLYFVCWNTQADGTGEDYYPGDTVLLPDADTTLELYAKYSDVRVITLVYHLGNNYAAASDFLPCDGYEKPVVDSILTGVGSETEKVVKTPFIEYNKSENETDRYPNTEIKASFDGSNPRRKFKVVSNSQGRFLGWSTDQGAFTPEVLDTDDIRVNTNGADGRGFIHLYPVWAICKVEDDDGEHPFPTLQTAYQYIKDKGLTTASIEMIEDYKMPATDALTLDESDYVITLTTAKSGEYVYSGEGNATIIRNYTGDSMFANEGTFTLTDIVLDGGYDFVTNTGFTSGHNGGIVYNHTGTLNIQTGAILRNSRITSDDGGAVEAKDGSTVTLNGCTITNCQANRYGGGIVIESGTSLDISGGVEITNCSAQHGGGIYTKETPTEIITNDDTINITGCTASGCGGGLFNAGGDVEISDNVTFDGCKAGWNGSAYTDSEGGKGGAIDNGSGTIEISGDVQIKNCGAYVGGGVYTEKPATTTITSLTISTCTAATNGGGLYVEGESGSSHGNLSLTNTAVTGCSVGTSGKGSALYLENHAVASINGGEIKNNSNCNGGAVAIGGAGASMTFAGDAVVYDNKRTDTTSQCNVYVNFDGNGIIKSAGLGENANIGVYVENTAASNGATTDKLFTDRGGVTDVFGSYTDTNGANVDKFVNDRNGLTAVTTENNGMMWQQPISVEVRYMPSATFGTAPDPDDYELLYKNQSYLLSADPTTIDELVESLPVDDFDASVKTRTMQFWRAYPEDETDYSNRITGVSAFAANGDYASVGTYTVGKWAFRGANSKNTPADAKTLVLYYSEPVYLEIQNNTIYWRKQWNTTSYLNNDQQNANFLDIARIVNDDGTTSPIESSDNQGTMRFNPNSSIKLMIVGGSGLTFSLGGGFDETEPLKPITVSVDDDEIETLEWGREGQSNSYAYNYQGRVTGTLGRAGQTTTVVFGKPNTKLDLTIEKTWEGGVGKSATFTVTQMKKTVTGGNRIMHVIVLRYPSGDNRNDASNYVADVYISGLPTKMTYRLSVPYQGVNIHWNGAYVEHIGADAQGDGTFTFTVNNVHQDTEGDIYISPAADEIVSASFDNKVENYDPTSFDDFQPTNKILDPIIFEYDEGKTQSQTVKLVQEDAQGNQYGYYIQETEVDPPSCKVTYTNGFNSPESLLTASGTIKVTNKVVVCKLTDDVDNLLYEDAAGTRPAVYSTLGAGITAAQSTLYKKGENGASGVAYSDNTKRVKIKMLVDSYDLLASDLTTDSTYKNPTVIIPTTRPITLTTALKSDTDEYPGYFVPGNRKTVCQINRGISTKSMFTVPANANFTTENITFDGGAVFNETTKDFSLGTEITYEYASGAVIVEGGIVNVSGTLAIDQGTTMQNSAVATTDSPNNGKTGGAVYVSDTGTLSITGIDDNVVTFTKCQAKAGGAIATGGASAYAGTVSMEYCTFYYCHAKGTTDNNGGGESAGGAIRCMANTFKLKHCEFEGCTSVQQGAGIYHKGRTEFEIKYCNFTHGHSGIGSVYATAGGAESQANKVTVDNCEFTYCSSNKNAGAFNVYNTGATITVSNSTFLHCKVNYTGTSNADFGRGGALRTTGSKTYVENCTFDSCQATRQGGAIHCKTSTEIKGTTRITNCEAIKSGGGAIFLEGGTLDYKAGTVENCFAPDGGAIYQGGGTCNFTGGSIIGCEATGSTGKGGGIYLDGNNSTLKIEGGTVSKCVAYDGGGIYQNNGTLNFNSGSITGCTAKHNGAGVNLLKGTFNLNGGSISACEATENGGGISLGDNNNAGQFAFSNGLIDGCSAKVGGGIYIANIAKDSNNKYIPVNITKNGDAITNCKAAAVTTDSVTGNKTYSYASANKGGGIFQNKGTLIIKNNAAIRNCEAYDGGGIYLSSDSGSIDLGVENQTSRSTISGCTADHHGGGIYQNKGDLDIYKGAEISDNTATNGNGGGIHLGSGVMDIHDGVIKRNKATKGSGGGISVGGGTFTITGGTIGGTSAADGNEAKRGGGLFLANGKDTNNKTNVKLFGGNITYNKATDQANVGGGGIAVGGINAKLQIQGTVVVRYNEAYDPIQGEDAPCNLLFDWDNSNNNANQRVSKNVDIITTTSEGLNRNSYIGVFVTGALHNNNSLFDRHGDWGKPFGNFVNNKNNLKCFVNDRTSLTTFYYGVPHPDSNYIYWAEYVCQITNVNRELLYETSDGIYPALYMYLGQYGAFDELAENRKFYTKNGNVATPSYVEMLVQDYDLQWEEGVNVPAKGIVLTTAKEQNSSYLTSTSNYVGYMGESGTLCTIKRGVSEGSMITMAEGANLTLKNINIDGGAKYTDEGVYESGEVDVNGVMFNAKGQLTLDENVILQNAATTASGGAILYSGGGTLTVKKGAKIQRCKANNGGVIAVDAAGGTVNIAANGGDVSQCVATNGVVYVNSGTVNLKGTITNESGDAVLTIAQSTIENGGGVYVGGGTVNLNGVVKGLTATENGGGAYVNGGKLQMPSTATGAVITGCSAKQGGGAYVNGGTFEIVNGSVTGNTATVSGGGVFVNGGATLTMNGYKDGNKQYTATIRENKAQAEEGATTPAKGGGIAVGDPVGDVNATLNFSNKVVVADNTMTVPVEGETAKEVLCNVYLDKDSNDIINVKAALSADASIGVYTSDDAAGTSTVDKKHGLSSMPFGRWDDSTNLKLFVNDRRPFLYGDTGEISGTIYWVSFICKITDEDGKLLYRDAAHTLPAVYKQLSPGQYNYNEDVPPNNSDYAFGTLMAAAPTLYQEDSDEVYTGAYRVEMLVPTSPWTKFINVLKDKDITLTTALGSEDENLQDDFPYVGEEGVPAQIIRDKNVANSQETEPMIIVRGNLTLKNIVLDGNNVETVTKDGAIVQIESGYSFQFARLTILENTTLRNGFTTGNGGAVYADIAGQTVTIAGGTETGETVTITGNTAKSGAGIYIGQGVTLKLSGDIDFGGTDVYATGDTLPTGKKIGDIKGTDGNFATGESLPEGSTNGQSAYERVRQDIYMAGYPYEESAANSIVVSGPISSAPGSIWVWVEKAKHYVILKQFAVLDDGLFKTEDEKLVLDADKMTPAQLTTSLEAFRNARPNAETECSGDYLTGQDGDDMEDVNGKTWKCVYWSGITGERKVILRKVDNGYATVTGEKFDIFKGNNDTAYTPKGATDSLANLLSGPSGCFWIGKLPYGTYFLHETTKNRWFYLIVDDSGVYCTLDASDATVVGGYDSRPAAEAAATAKYEAIKTPTPSSGEGA